MKKEGRKKNSARFSHAWRRCKWRKIWQMWLFMARLQLASHTLQTFAVSCSKQNADGNCLLSSGHAGPLVVMLDLVPQLPPNIRPRM